MQVPATPRLYVFYSDRYPAATPGSGPAAPRLTIPKLCSKSSTPPWPLQKPGPDPLVLRYSFTPCRRSVALADLEKFLKRSWLLCETCRGLPGAFHTASNFGKRHFA